MPKFHVIADGYTFYAGDNEAKAQKEIKRLQARPTIHQINYYQGKQVQKIEGLAKR